MLTLNASIRAQRQAAAFGEGRHRFGLGCDKVVPTPQRETTEPSATSEEKPAKKK